MLADYLGDDEEAQDHYQRWKRCCIAQLPSEGWTLTKDEMAVAWYRCRQQAQETERLQ
jgi:hypothetical protein